MLEYARDRVVATNKLGKFRMFSFPRIRKSDTGALVLPPTPDVNIVILTGTKEEHQHNEPPHREISLQEIQLRIYRH